MPPGIGPQRPAHQRPADQPRLADPPPPALRQRLVDPERGKGDEVDGDEVIGEEFDVSSRNYLKIPLDLNRRDFSIEFDISVGDGKGDFKSAVAKCSAGDSLKKE